MSQRIFFISSFFFLAMTIAVSLYLTDLLASGKGLPPDLSPVQSAFVQARSELYEKIFDLFLAMIALVSAASAIVGIGIYSVLKSRLEYRIQDTIERRSRIDRARTQAWTFNEFAYTWYLRYEPALQKVLRKESLTKYERSTCLDFINAATDVAQQGMHLVEEIDASGDRKDFDNLLGKKVRIHLINQNIYSATAKIIVAETSESLEMIDHLKSQANELIELSLDKELARDKFDWHLGQETAAFFFVHCGISCCDKNMVRDGKRILRNLINEKRPRRYLAPLPAEWRNTIAEEYELNGISLASV